jgi:hypothetical protein
MSQDVTRTWGPNHSKVFPGALDTYDCKRHGVQRVLSEVPMPISFSTTQWRWTKPLRLLSQHVAAPENEGTWGKYGKLIVTIQLI